MGASNEHKAQIDVGYEMYQIIKDFTNPIQIFREAFQNSIDAEASEVYCEVNIRQRLGMEDLIIDVWDNGSGIREEHIPCFFDLANSTKVTPEKTPTQKLGYKGHGTKIYFNCERVEIFTKPDKGKLGWGIVLDDPLNQIREHGIFSYSAPVDVKGCSIRLPDHFETGLFVRIRNPYHFKTQHTRYMLNHAFLRDYAKWYTVFGTISPLFVNNGHETILYLKGLSIDHFQKTCCDISEIDPVPVFTQSDSHIFEKLSMGHYFPPERRDDKSMEAYVKKLQSNKPYYDYYSRQIFKDRVYLDNNIFFDFIISTEGFETKRRYDVLLPRRGKNLFDKTLQHNDGERYGLWACKGGVPIERVDDWILGGRGVGSFTYMHAFIDCDAFELTANRGSIRNTDVEILDKVRDKINATLSDKKIKTAFKEREDWEEYVKRQRSIDEDGGELTKRFNSSKNRKHIILPNGFEMVEPSKTKSGYSESETLIVLINVLSQYPDLFSFKLMDYNTTKGIDFVVEKSSSPRYIELKGTFQKKVNHSFRNVFKFICYDIDMDNNETVEDIEPLTAKLRINKNDRFQSMDQNFHDKTYVSYQLIPDSAQIQSMEIIVLKDLLKGVVGANIA
jgi:hypothetical protein